MKVFVNHDYAASKYAFDTTRKAVELLASLRTQPIKGVEILDPGTADAVVERIIDELHDGRYVNAVRTGNPRPLAERQGFDWDPGIYPMAVAHAQGLVRATQVALEGGTRAGSLSSGLHHASRQSGAGYCTFNGLAVASTAAHFAGAERVLCIDFDAHCGGGTFDIMQDQGWFTQVDVSTSAFDVWEPTGDHYLSVGGNSAYIQRIDQALQHADSLGSFDFIIYNAGMDPINTGVSVALVQERERMVSDFIGKTPAVFALAGGYTWGSHTMEELVSWHRMTIETWATH